MQNRIKPIRKTSPTLKPEFDVVVVGEINADLILSGNVVPEFGQVEQIVDDAKLVMGSSAVIFACGAARLGLRTTFIGKVGKDIFGQFMMDSLIARNVDTSGVKVDPGIQTGLTVILARQNDRAILTYPGSIPTLDFSEVNFDLVSKCIHLHLSSYFMLDRLRPNIPNLFSKAKKMGLSTSLDTNYDPAEKWDEGLLATLKFVDIFLPNETEAKAISTETDLIKALDHLAGIVPIIAVKMGHKGAAAKCTGEPLFKMAPPTVAVIDTVGAGDSFDAGFIYGHLHHWDLERTLKLAVACGSLSTRAAGGTDAQPELKEVAEYLHQI